MAKEKKWACKDPLLQSVNCYTERGRMERVDLPSYPSHGERGLMMMVNMSSECYWYSIHVSGFGQEFNEFNLSIGSWSMYSIILLCCHIVHVRGLGEQGFLNAQLPIPITLQPKTKVLGSTCFSHPSSLIPPLSKLLLMQILYLYCILYRHLQHWIWGRGRL